MHRMHPGFEMIAMATYEQIHSIEAELCRYRKGSLCVSIDMERGLITWKDSNHWVNDFTRSLDREMVQTIRNGLEDAGVLEWDDRYGTAEPVEACTHGRSFWSIVIRTEEESLKRYGVDLFPPQWNDFRTLIENISRTSFDL